MLSLRHELAPPSARRRRRVWRGWWGKRWTDPGLRRIVARRLLHRLPRLALRCLVRGVRLLGEIRDEIVARDDGLVLHELAVDDDPFFFLGGMRRTRGQLGDENESSRDL